MQQVCQNLIIKKSIVNCLFYFLFNLLVPNPPKPPAEGWAPKPPNVGAVEVVDVAPKPPKPPAALLVAVVPKPPKVGAAEVAVPKPPKPVVVFVFVPNKPVD